MCPSSPNKFCCTTFLSLNNAAVKSNFKNIYKDYDMRYGDHKFNKN